MRSNKWAPAFYFYNLQGTGKNKRSAISNIFMVYKKRYNKWGYIIRNMLILLYKFSHMLKYLLSRQLTLFYKQLFYVFIIYLI